MTSDLVELIAAYRLFSVLPQDLKRVEDGVIVSIADMELWTTRIFEAIDNGFAQSVSTLTCAGKCWK